MPVQYRPRRHRIRPPETLGLLPRQGSPIHQHLVTLYLLEAIKGACSDRSIGGITRSHNSRLSWTSRRLQQSHTHSTHTLRLMSPSLSHTRL
jgi:hypothetical protein